MILYTLGTGVRLSVCAYVCWCSDRYIRVTCYACLHCMYVCVAQESSYGHIHVTVLFIVFHKQLRLPLAGQVSDTFYSTNTSCVNKQ